MQWEWFSGNSKELDGDDTCVHRNEWGHAWSEWIPREYIAKWEKEVTAGHKNGIWLKEILKMRNSTSQIAKWRVLPINESWWRQNQSL